MTSLARTRTDRPRYGGFIAKRGGPARLPQPAWPPPPPASPTAIVQGNLAILPEKLAASFHRFCQLNPKPCPIIGMSDVGDPRIPALGIDLDIRTDLPRYRVWRDGEVVEEPTDIMAHWRDDLVAFVIGCSYLLRGSVAGGRSADPPHRAQRARADVPHQYRLRLRGTVRRADGGVDAAVQAGGCDPRGADHLALSLRARRAGSSRPSACDRHRRHRQARLRRCGAGRRPTKFRCSGRAASRRNR